LLQQLQLGIIKLAENVTTNADILIERLQMRINKLDPNSKSFYEAAYRIGTCVVNRAKLNIREKDIVDTGRLLNSIVFEIIKDKGEIRIGSAGVKYASLHEFGGEFTEKMRMEMWEAFNMRGKVRQSLAKDKNVIQGNKVIARPYLRPALRGCIPIIRKILNTYLGEVAHG